MFPEKVLALTSYNSYAYCKVVWEDSLTEYTPQAEAETVFYGSVSGYDGKVKLTIKGENFTITEVEPVAYEIFKYGEFDFPEKVNVKIENGQTRNAVVNWIDNEGFDSSKVGEYTYYGQLRGTSVPAQITIKVNPLDIASVDTVELLSRYGEVPLLPEMIKVNLNGDITAYENVSWQFAPISVPAIGVHNIVGEIQDSTVAANGILNVFSNINNKVVNETLANYKEGYALAFAPWSTSNPKIKIEVDGNGDKVAHYFGTHDFLTLAPAQYSGKVISSIRMKMKRNTSEFRYQMMEGTIPMVSVIFLPDGSIKVEGAENENNLFENAYKLNEYFVMDLVVDIDNRVYDIYINGLMVAKNIYFAGSMEGNALKNIRMADRSTSNDSADVYMNNIILYELQAPLRAELESISLESTVKENIALPQKTENGYKILWSSNKPEVINNNGEVTRQDYNASVVLTATLKAEFGMGVTEYKSDYTITVPKRDITDRQIVDAAITELTEDKISQENISSVTEDLSLPLLSASGATINWKSSDEKIITHQGLIIRPASDTTVKLTATVSSGSVSETKEFRITVKKQVGELDSIQCVRHAMASTTIPETISNDIVLPSTAGKSVDVVWYSDNLSILANSGKINKKSKGGKVNLTAVFSKDEYRITKVYPVTVKVTASPSGSSGGGGGGGKSPSTPILGSVVPEIKPSVSSSNSKFPDIGNHAWAEEAINSLSEKGIISGYENGCFYPQNNISREEFVKLTVSAFDIDVIDEDVNFSDVSQDAWFKKYLSTALKNGIVSGYDNGTFGTGNTITRQDMVVMIFNALNNALELNIEESEPAFADNDDIADYAAGKIGALTKLNIISGVGENRFAPLNPATRAEAAKLIYQIILKYYK